MLKNTSLNAMARLKKRNALNETLSPKHNGKGVMLMAQFSLKRSNYSHNGVITKYNT
jgi:hypothetical protein